jgi:NAD(P)H-hydrate epimerase
VEDLLLSRARNSGCKILDYTADDHFLALEDAVQNHGLLLDGILGTGIRLPLGGALREIISFVKQTLEKKKPDICVIAVDCPSGVDCDTGEAAPETIPAELTVTMAAVKQGLLKFPAYSYVGELRCIGIGLPAGLDRWEAVKRTVVDQAWVQSFLPDRPLDAHKSTFGVVMVIAGSRHYSGAALLAGEAAFRSGAGWVTLAVPEFLHAPLSGRFVEATWLPLPHQKGWISEPASKIILENIERVNTIILGPGFGLDIATKHFMRNLLVDGKGKLPMLVVDADGLKMLPAIPNWYELLPAPAVLTPHPGEMAVLTGSSIEQIMQNRAGVAEAYAQKWGHVVVLKGAMTVIASPNGQTAIIPIATPALARAGTGDVLAGLIGGFCAQGLDAFESAVVGAWTHGRAGLWAVDILGSTAAVLAGDVLEAVKDVMADYASGQGT